jgi:nucleoid DNA-binding protein
MINIQKIKEDLKENGYVEIEGFGVFELLPRKQGKTFCGFRNKEGTPQFSKRLRFKVNRKLRNELCK